MRERKSKSSKVDFYINVSRSLKSLTFKPLYKTVTSYESGSFVSYKVNFKTVQQQLFSGEKLTLNNKVSRYLAHKPGFYNSVIRHVDKAAEDLIFYSDKIVRARKAEQKQKWKGMRGVAYKQFQNMKQLRNSLIKSK